MTTDTPPLSNLPSQVGRRTARLRLRPGHRVKSSPSAALQTEADKRKEEREIAREKRDEQKAERDDRASKLTRRVATSAVIVSLITGIATSSVAVISMRTTDSQAQSSLASADRRAEKTFLRDQQKVAYADFYTSAVEVEQAFSSITQLFFSARPISLYGMASGSEVNSYRKGRLNELSKIMSDR